MGNQTSEEKLMEVVAIQEILDKTLTIKKSKFYFLLLLSSALTAVISTVSSVYLTEKISSFVVKEEFSDSLSRLEMTVQRTEEIQQEIKSQFSDDLESNKILRVKYEELYLSTIELVDLLGLQTKTAINREFPIIHDKPIQKILMLQSLYFPLIERDFFAVHNAYLDYQKYLVELSESPERRFYEPNLSKEVVAERNKVKEEIDKYRALLVRKYAKKINL